MTISYIAGRHGLAASFVFRWRRLIRERGEEAVRTDDEVGAVSEVGGSRIGFASLNS